MFTFCSSKSYTTLVMVFILAIVYSLLMPWEGGSQALPAWTALWDGERFTRICRFLFESRLAGIVLILSELVMLIRMLHRFLSENDFLPGWIFLIGCTLLLSVPVSNAMLAALLCVTAAIHRSIRFLHHKFEDRSAYDIGLLLGFAGLLYGPASFFIIIFWLRMVQMSSSFGRSFTASLLGLVTPPFLLQTTLFVWKDMPWSDFPHPLRDALSAAGTPSAVHLSYSGILLALLLLPAAVIALVTLWKRIHTYQADIRMFWFTLQWMLVAAVLGVLLLPGHPADLLWFCLPCMSTVVAWMLVHTKHEQRAARLFNTMLALSAAVQIEGILTRMGLPVLRDGVLWLVQLISSYLPI